MDGEVLPAVIRSGGAEVIPAVVVEAGSAARFVWEEFFVGEIRNRHTRRAYAHAVRRFLAWCEAEGATLQQVTPGLVGRYLDRHPGGIPTRKQHLAALRGFFDMLVLRHVVVLNPAASVRAERYQVEEGKTPEITAAQARTLFHSIGPGDVAGLRDRAIIAVLIFTAARVGAVARLRLDSLSPGEGQASLRFDEKGGKCRDIPLRADLGQYLFAYLEAAGLHGPAEGPMFRTAKGRSGNLSARAMSAGDVGCMLKRRLKAAGLPEHLSPHSFRVATATNLLGKGVPLEEVQHLLGHADPRTTRLYDRRAKKVSRRWLTGFRSWMRTRPR